MVTDKTYPAALPHGDIIEVFSDLYFVTGSIVMGSLLPMRFSRNMTIIREGDELTLVNSVRLDEAGLAQLDKLGKVTNVIRLAAFHGMDDPFYQDHYGAKIWSVNAPYVSGFSKDPQPEDVYFHSDLLLSESTELPVKDAKVIELTSCSPSETLLLLERDDGIIISGDCMQNWDKPDEYFNLFAKIMMRLMGFIKPCNIGPGWLRTARPDPTELKNILNLNFQHVLPAHGRPVINDAKALFTPVFSRL